jgi:hypothetical protein
MNEQSTISRNLIVNQIIKISHRDLETYLPVGIQAVRDEPELFAHLIAWNNIKGEVRDTKVALPVIALRGEFDRELSENAIAHLCTLDPKNLLKAIHLNKQIKSSYPIARGNGNFLESAIEQYIQIRENNTGWWIRTALQHRKSLKALYALFHVKPNVLAQAVLFDRKKPKGSVFEAIANLRTMSPLEAAGTILHFKIPFLIAMGAVGGIKNNTDIIMALIDQTSGSELINNTNLFKKLGVFENPVLKAAFDSAVERAKKDKRVSSFKAGQAITKIKDETISKKIESIQEEKLEQLGGIDGKWLVLGDCSGSMQQSVETAKLVSACIAQQVNDEVNLIFFNADPHRYDVTGKNLEEIKSMTSRIRAQGNTSIGCGLDMMAEDGKIINGIAIVSDGGENTRPLFVDAYRKYVAKTGIEPTVYLLWLPGNMDVLSRNCAANNISLQKMDISRTDYYAIPNLIKTLRSNKYSLIDEIMSTSLLKLSDVFGMVR